MVSPTILPPIAFVLGLNINFISIGFSGSFFGVCLVHLVPIKKTYERVKNAMKQEENVQCEEEEVNDEEGIQLDDMVFETSEKTEPK